VAAWLLRERARQPGPNVAVIADAVPVLRDGAFVQV